MENKADNCVVGLGEILWDVFQNEAKLGGAPANFAFHVGQFGFHTLAISAIGNDELGDKTIEQLNAKGLKSILSRVQYPTGRVLVSLNKEGIPTYDIKENAAWDNMPFTDDMLHVAQRCKAVCWGTLAQRSEVSRASIYKFLINTPKDCLKIFDINLRLHFYNKDIIEQGLTYCNILKLNDDELVVLSQFMDCSGLDSETICRLILERYNISILILTCGTKGSYVFTANIKSVQNTPKVNVADTVGAGDSFTAAFCSSILKGASIVYAHRLAVEVSAYVCSQHGAMPILPDSFLK